MHILIADKIAASVIDRLNELGCVVTMEPDLTAEDLPRAVGKASILVVRSTKVTAETIAAAKPLSLIIRAGAGVNTIDLNAASSRGVYVANCPGKNTAAVAELAIGLLIAADRQIVPASIALRAGKWKKKQFSAAHGLAGRTLGIVGLGAIGRAVAVRAQAMEMNVVAFSRSLTEQQAESLEIERASSLEDLAAVSDAVSVHLAMHEETRGIIGASFFEQIRPGALFVNTSRGEVVDEAALKQAIDAKQLRVGLDVFSGEPAGGEADFASTDLASMIAATPHIGASTAQAADAVADEVVRIASEFIRTGKPPAAVNLCELSSATFNLVVRHANRVGVLAGILDGLREEGVNVEEMENVIFQGAEAACCTLSLDQAPSAEFLQTLASDENIINITCEPSDQ